MTLTASAPSITFVTIFSNLAFLPSSASNIPTSAAGVTWALTPAGSGLNRTWAGITATGNTNGRTLRASVGAIFVDIPISSSGFPSGPGSNTCFIAGTPVKTDQGFIPIEKLDHAVNTIDGQPIVAITKITSTDSYLIHIPKDHLGVNVPDQDTTISQLHKVLYNGVMTPAKEVPGISKVDYDGQLLYNVLLDTYGKMTVNGLTVETLHPRANVAVLYKHITTNKLSDVERDKMIQMFNKRIQLGDNLRKAFFENIVLIIMVNVLLEPKSDVEVTPYSVMRAFVPQCCPVNTVEQTLALC